MIYSKFLACTNPLLKGVYIDSPNIRLELESPTGEQRGRYLIDFSQMDVELRREKFVTLEEYFDEEEKVKAILHRTLERSSCIDRQKRGSWAGSTTVNSQNKTGN